MREDTFLKRLSSATFHRVYDFLSGFKTDKAVAEFVGEAEQFDDLTMLCVEYRGRQAAEEKEHEGTDG